MASCYALQDFIEPLLMPVNSMLSTEKSLQYSLCYFFKVKTLSSSDKTAASAASMPIFLAPAIVYCL